MCPLENQSHLCQELICIFLNSDFLLMLLQQVTDHQICVCVRKRPLSKKGKSVLVNPEIILIYSNLQYCLVILPLCSPLLICPPPIQSTYFKMNKPPSCIRPFQVLPSHFISNMSASFTCKVDSHTMYSRVLLITVATNHVIVIHYNYKRSNHT